MIARSAATKKAVIEISEGNQTIISAEKNIAWYEVGTSVIELTEKNGLIDLKFAEILADNAGKLKFNAPEESYLFDNIIFIARARFDTSTISGESLGQLQTEVIDAARVINGPIWFQLYEVPDTISIAFKIADESCFIKIKMKSREEATIAIENFAYETPISKAILESIEHLRPNCQVNQMRFYSKHGVLKSSSPNFSILN